MRLVNERTGVTIARDVEVAATRASRRTGLLGRASLDPASALVLERCFAIHTAFMRFAIDAVFLDRRGVVRRVVSLPPWRIAATFGAAAVVELAAGAARDVQVGDRIYRLDESD
jgi:uncharacterized membrane protein (UPF0127 family)